MLNREEIKSKAICTKCKYCKEEAIEHKSWTEYRFYCTNAITYLDPIKGDEEYANCVLINPDAKCENFEKPERTAFERFLAFLTGKKD